MTKPATNPLLARFADVPSLVAPALKSRFEGALAAVMGHERSETLLSAYASADDGFWFSPDDWRAAYRPYVVRDGVLMIPVKGVLLHDFPWALGSWATGYAYIARALDRGLADVSVRAVALICDSCGGEAAGCFDTADRIFAARGAKPIRAFAETALSAGYALASAADSIVVSSTALVGSIGVVMAHTDVSRAMEEAGVKITFVFAGKHKVDGNSYQPLPDEVKARWQTWCDEKAELFWQLVARNRGLDVTAVQATEADCYSASEGLANGLADTIAPLDDAVTAFILDPSAADDDDEGETDMSTTASNATGGAAAALDAARAAGFTDGQAAGKAEGHKEGAAAERGRIGAILGSEEAKGRDALAHHLAFDTDMSADGAKALLAKAAKEDAPAAAATPPADPLTAAMSRVTNPQVGADGAAGQSEAAKAAALAGSIVTAYRGKAAVTA